jgi:hypothetical protein
MIKEWRNNVEAKEQQSRSGTGFERYEIEVFP